MVRYESGRESCPELLMSQLYTQVPDQNRLMKTRTNLVTTRKSL